MPTSKQHQFFVKTLKLVSNPPSAQLAVSAADGYFCPVSRIIVNSHSEYPYEKKKTRIASDIKKIPHCATVPRSSFVFLMLHRAGSSKNRLPGWFIEDYLKIYVLVKKKKNILYRVFQVIIFLFIGIFLIK